MRTPLLPLLLLLMTIGLTMATSRASVMVSPSSSQFFQYKTFTVSCQQLNSADWTVWRYTTDSPEPLVTRCGSDWGRPTSSGCLLNTCMSSDSGVYWCASTRGGSSRGINITITDKSVILLSPALPVKKGEDVTLHCQTKSPVSKSPARFFRNGCLIGNGTAGHMTIHNFSESNQGDYSCEFSGSNKSLDSWLLIEVGYNRPLLCREVRRSTSLRRASYLFMIVMDDSDSASLSVWPNLAQLFEYENLYLNCSHSGRSLGWKVVRASNNATSNEKLRLQHCRTWGQPTSSGCAIQTLKVHDTGLYWCESPSKARSNLVNISVYNSPVMLQIPALPVKEGTNVTLHCNLWNKPSNLKTTFYKNDDPLKTDPTGHMTIVHVSRSDEGIYWCKINDYGKSPPSWLFVTGPDHMDNSRSELTHNLLSVMRHLLVFCPYCISTVLVVSLHRTTAGGHPPVSRADDDRLDQLDDEVVDDVITEYHF